MSINETIDRVTTLLRECYVFSDRAQVAADAIEASRVNGGYDDLNDAALAAALTEQMFDICSDRHLQVRTRSDSAEQPPDPISEAQQWRVEEEADNFGIAQVQRLDGNVGYLDLRSVTNPGYGGDAIAAAMLLVAHTHALIIDLRRNGGGWPDGAILWCSYLFPDADTHLNDVFDARTGVTKQYWSLGYIPGARYLDRPVYVLTSAETFSAAEEIAYSLQARGRATLIGQTTRGGAHPSRTFAVTPTLEMTIPFARAINPVTGTNWEGVGVVPDIQVPAAHAYDRAYSEALRHVLASEPAKVIAGEAAAALAALV